MIAGSGVAACLAAQLPVIAGALFLSWATTTRRHDCRERRRYRAGHRRRRDQRARAFFVCSSGTRSMMRHFDGRRQRPAMTQFYAEHQADNATSLSMRVCDVALQPAQSAYRLPGQPPRDSRRAIASPRAARRAHEGYRQETRKIFSFAIDVAGIGLGERRRRRPAQLASPRHEAIG